MIKNIVFDLGGVLIDFKPEKYLEHIGFSKEDINLFTQIVFYGKEWNAYNSSKYNAEQTEKNLIQNCLTVSDFNLDGVFSDMSGKVTSTITAVCRKNNRKIYEYLHFLHKNYP